MISLASVRLLDQTNGLSINVLSLAVVAVSEEGVKLP